MPVTVHLGSTNKWGHQIFYYSFGDQHSSPTSTSFLPLVNENAVAHTRSPMRTCPNLLFAPTWKNDESWRDTIISVGDIISHPFYIIHVTFMSGVRPQCTLAFQFVEISATGNCTYTACHLQWVSVIVGTIFANSNVAISDNHCIQVAKFSARSICLFRCGQPFTRRLDSFHKQLMSKFNGSKNMNWCFIFARLRKVFGYMTKDSCLGVVFEICLMHK